jgi:hypothetical protein
LPLFLFDHEPYASLVIRGIFKRTGVACAAVASSVLVVVAAVPAQAGTNPGWRHVVSKHYGPAQDYSGYEVVVANGKNSAWALGGTDLSGGNGTVQRPVAMRWNGRNWSGYTLPSGLTSTIIAASAPAANDIWAVTSFGGYILHWNGTAWSVAKRLPWNGKGVEPQLTGVVALSPKNVWAFGESGFTLGWGTWHYNGKSWSQWRGNAGDLADGSAVSAGNIWAIGGPLAPQSAIVHYTGTWKLVTARALSGLQFTSIRAFSAKDVWVSATTRTNDSQSWLVHYNGSTWARVKVPWTMSVGALTADGHGGLWVTGFNVTPKGAYTFYVVHRTATGALSRITVGPSLTSGLNLSSVALIPGTSSVWGAGSVQSLTVGGSAVIAAYGQI